MTAQEMIVDRWREVPAIPSNGFPGMTELSKGGRFVQVCATGPEARAMLVRHVETVPAPVANAPANDDDAGRPA